MAEEELTLSGDELSSLERVAFSLYNLYRAGITDEAFQAVLHKAAFGWALHHGVKESKAEAALGFALHRVMAIEWVQVVIKRGVGFISGKVVNPERVADDQAVIDFVRAGLAKVPTASGGSDGEAEHEGNDNGQEQA
jgi:hypothetical protein